MSYIFSDLKTKLQTQVGDPNLTDSIAGDALAYTEQDIFNKFDLTLNSDKQTNTITSGTNTLTSSLPTDFQRVSNLYVTSPVNYSQSLKKYFMTPDAFREAYPAAGTTLYGSGPPTTWTYWDSIEFAYLVDQTYTLKLDYIKNVPILASASDVPTIPQSFEEMLILGSKIRIFEQKEDFDYASQFYNRFADIVEAFVARYGVRQVDVQVQVGSGRQRVMGR